MRLTKQGPGRVAALLAPGVRVVLAFLVFLVTGVEGVPRGGAVDRSESTPVLRILAVGDSITQGGRRDRPEYTYRLPLQRRLKQEGISFDFVGSRRAGLHADATWPRVSADLAFDPDHEGYYGLKTGVVVSRVLPVLETFPPPDVVLVHLGTNDQSTEDVEADVVRPLGRLIEALRARNPGVTVLLGHLNFNDSRKAEEIRRGVEALAERMDRPGSRVRTVHPYRGWREKPRVPGSHTFDWAHPNPEGQERMAEVWWEGMRGLVPGISSAWGGLSRE